VLHPAVTPLGSVSREAPHTQHAGWADDFFHNERLTPQTRLHKELLISIRLPSRLRLGAGRADMHVASSRGTLRCGLSGGSANARAIAHHASPNGHPGSCSHYLYLYSLYISEKPTKARSRGSGTRSLHTHLRASTSLEHYDARVLLNATPPPDQPIRIDSVAIRQPLQDVDPGLRDLHDVAARSTQAYYWRQRRDGAEPQEYVDAHTQYYTAEARAPPQYIK